jgi:hypothetical protein
MPRPRSIAALLAFAVCSSPLAGQTVRNHLYDKFQLGGSLTTVILNTNVRIDGSQGDIGGEVDAEEDLGLARTKLQPRFNLRWRPGRRHELEVGYQFARRTGGRTLTKDFDIGDTSFTAGLRTKSRFDTDQASLNYRFAFMAREKTQVGVGIGLGAIFLGTGIDALVSASSGGKADSISYSHSSNLTGPTASLGFYGRFQVGKAWYLEADLRGVKVAIDRFDASIIEGGAAARYFVSSRLGIEGGYGLSSINVDIGPRTTATGGERGATGTIKYSLQNIRLGLVYAL